MDNNSIKENIAKLRKSYGLTQTEMAARLGMSRTAYRNLENGKTHLISENIDKISELLEMSPEEIVLGYQPSDGKGPKLGEGHRQGDYGPSRREIERECEAKVAALRDQNDALKGYVDALREIIRTKDEVITMLKSYNDAK